jgi:hypothetical protein
MNPYERAWAHYERTAQVNVLSVPLLTAHSLRNLAAEVEKTTPRSDWIAKAIRALADDVEAGHE